MNDKERRRYEMFIRVREFGADHAAQLPPTSLAGELLARLNTVITEIDTHTTSQASGRSAAQESYAGKAAARDELRRDLEAMSRTARVMALSTPGLEDKFRIPRSPSDQTLLTTARAFASDALPLKNEFMRRGLPDEFLEELQEDIEEFEQAINQAIHKRGTHVSATAAIDDAVDRGLDIVRELDQIVRNIYADDPATLTAWLSAGHTERKRRRQPNPAPGTQPAP